MTRTMSISSGYLSRVSTASRSEYNSEYTTDQDYGVFGSLQEFDNEGEYDYEIDTNPEYEGLDAEVCELLSQTCSLSLVLHVISAYQGGGYCLQRGARWLSVLLYMHTLFPERV